MLQHVWERARAAKGIDELVVASDSVAYALTRSNGTQVVNATSAPEAVHETADLFYMGLVALVRSGGSLAEVLAELERRHGSVGRRPMVAK